MTKLYSVAGVLVCAAMLALPSSAHAQGGAPAPNFEEPCPALYPGDDAAKERLARWRLSTRIAARQRALAAGGIAVGVRCPDADCLSGATATLTVRDRERTLRATAIEPSERGYGRLVLQLPRLVRRELAHGRSVRAGAEVCAADAAANASSRRRSVLLLP